MRGRTLPLVMLMPGVAFAQSSAQGDIAVTIYNNDQALVQDTRQINLVRGINRHEFPDVSDSIRPETVRLSIADATIVEQNFDYDLLSPSALIEKAVGQTITIVRTNPATGAETRERAKVLASNNGVVLQIGNSIEVLRDDGLPVRVVYDSLPPNLRARPTLSISLESKAPGTRPGTLSYLTGGLGWSADYVALFDEGKSTIDVQGWVTLRNNNHVAFANTEATLVAGTPGSGGRGGRGGIAPGTLPGTESAARQRLGDFYLYPIDHRVTIARNQQKQVSFLSVGGVPAKKLYRFANGWLGAQSDAVSAQTVLSFSSSRNGGLGDALPAGTVRVYIRDAKGQPQFIGENHIDHTPMGSTLAIPTGEAFDVKVKSTVEKRQTIKSDEWERSAKYRITFGNRPPRVVTIDRSITYYRTGMSYTLTNARPEPVTVEVVQGGLDRGGWEDTRVSSESVPGEQRSFDERVWNVTVPASGQTVLTADFDTRY
ncbi:DUF4139 domain-containing protein [Sphingomonas lycopersici]|uniref:DUF4139 domain-containing protein n=1 Tax=Sphingomonas lycopersici TaxID=2951807 RepID=A0AA41Z7H0_9SPHN|nr:DUF4139 domain-containing protein [Sphingomonas lycopersici]MCW6534031.1 DUF4139 domain-containing protein [Sphingomonas lycopersici]